MVHDVYMQHQSAYTENALVSVWKRAPEHSISCLASLSPRESDKSLQQDMYLVSGSESGHICLWRQRTEEDNLHPIALVVARDKRSRVTALCTFWFDQSPVFVAAYDDGYVTVHELMLGDSIISLQVLPDEFVVRHFQVVQANVSDPFVQILCIPESHHSKIVVLRVGLGEGYQGSLSLLTTLDHVGSKVLNAVLLQRRSISPDSAGVSAPISSTPFAPAQHSQAKQQEREQSDIHNLRVLDHNQVSAKRHSLKVCDTGRSFSLPELQMPGNDSSRAATGHRGILLLTMCSSSILRLWSLGTIWGALGSLKLQSKDYLSATPHRQQEQELVDFNVSPDESLLVLIWRQNWVVCQLQLLNGHRPVVLSPLMQIPQHPPTSFCSSSTTAAISTAFFSLDGKKLFLLNLDYSSLAIVSLPTASGDWEELQTDVLIEVPLENSVSPSDGLQSGLRHCCFTRQDDSFVYLVCNRLASGSFFQLDLSTTVGKVRSLCSVFPSPNCEEAISTLCLLAGMDEPVKIVCGFDSGRIECFALGNSAGNSISLIGHRHKVSALKRAEIILDGGKASTVSNHRVFLLSGSVDGVVFVWDSISFAQVGKFCVHSDEIVSFRVLSSSLFAVIARDNAFSVYLVREVPVASSSTSSGTVTSIRPQLLASGHDSPVRHVLRSAWCDLADYVVSVSDSDSVYIWALASGNLDRVLVGSEARIFLISRGLATGVSDSANQHRQQQLLPTGFLDSLDDLVFLGQGADRGPLIEKTCPNGALGTLVGLPASLHIDVLVLDVISSLRLQKSFEQSHISRSKSDSAGSLPSGGVREVLHEHARCVLSLLLDWGVNAALESSVQSTLSLFDLQSLLQSFSPSARIAFAAFGNLAHTRTSIQQQAPFSLTILLPGYRSDVGCDGDNSSALQRRWQFSHRFCALYSLYINAFSMRLMSCGVSKAQALFSRLMAGYTVVLPDTLPAFKEPSIRMLASYCLHEDDAIHMAAKLLLEGVIHRMSLRRRQAIFKQWARIFDSLDLSDGSLSVSPSVHLSPPDIRRCHLQRHPSRDYAMNESLSQFDVVSHSDKKLVASIVLCMVAIQSEKCSSQSASEALLFDASLCKRLSSSLLTVIRSASIRTSAGVGSSSSRVVDQTNAGSPQHLSPVASSSSSPAASVSLSVSQRRNVWRSKVEQQIPCSKPALVRISLAADLFGAGARLWCSHLTDISSVFSLLLVLSHSSEATNTEVATSCQRALIEMAAVESRAFIAAMTTKTLATDALRSNAIMAVLLLIKKYPQSLLGRSQASIQLLAETITSCLDPGEPTTRRALLRPGTAVLHLLTKKYPMVAFHQRSQMFAVGSNSADKSKIVIYDLRTATKWRVIEGDFGAIWAVAFNSTGTLLASYSGGTRGSLESRAAPSIRIWKMTTSGLISGLLGLQNECVRTIDLAPTSERIFAQQLLHNIQLSWPSATSVRLQREDRSICCFSL